MISRVFSLHSSFPTAKNSWTDRQSVSQADGRWPFMIHPTEPNGAFSSQVPRARFNVRLLNVDCSVMTCQGSLRERLSFSRMDRSVPLIIDLVARSVLASKGSKRINFGKNHHSPRWNLFKSSCCELPWFPGGNRKISRSPFHTHSAAAAAHSERQTKKRIKPGTKIENMETNGGEKVMSWNGMDEIHYAQENIKGKHLESRAMKKKKIST